MSVRHTVAAVFWNGQEHRLRAGWRLALQLLLWLVLSIVAAIAIEGVRQVWGDRAGDWGLGTYVPADIEFLVASLMTIVSVWLAGRLLDRRRLADFGLHLSRRWWLDFAFGLTLGAASMAAIFLVEWLAGWLTIAATLRSTSSLSFSAAIVLSLLAFVGVGVGEELFSRGYQIKNLAEGLNLPWLGPRAAVVVAYLLSSALFGLLHAANPNATTLSTLMLMLAGLELGLAYVLTGELGLPIGLHIAWNFFQGNVFGFPVSGADLDATFITICQGGPDAWTGGAFGPEAGLLGLLASLGNMLAILLWVRYQNRHLALHQPLAHYQGHAGKQTSKDSSST